MRSKLLLSTVTVLLVASLAIVGCAQPAPAPAPVEVIKWKAQSPWPSGMILQDSAVRVAENIRGLSNGRIDMKMLPAGSIVDAFDILEATQRGTLDLAASWPPYFMGKYPAANMFGGANIIPSGLEFWTWFMYGEGRELMQELYGEDVVVLPPYRIGPAQSIGWSHKPITKLEDFQGVKIRAAGAYGEMLNRLGASVVSLPAGELYGAMERRVVDAVEFAAPCVDKDLGIYEVAEYLIVPGVHQPVDFNETYANSDSWAELSDNLKFIVERACTEGVIHALGNETLESAKAMRFFIDYGIEVLELTPETQGALLRLMAEVLADAAAEDPLYAEVLESQIEWHETWEVFSSYYTIVTE